MEKLKSCSQFIIISLVVGIMVCMFAIALRQHAESELRETQYRYEIVADGKKYNVLLYNVTPAASESKFSLVLYMTSYFRHDLEIVVTNYSARKL